MQYDTGMDVPTPRPTQGSFPVGESLKFKLRRARIQEMERQQEVQDSIDTKMTEEQLRILIDSFASIKFEGHDLDGLSWSDPKWKSVHALWNEMHPHPMARSRYMYETMPICGPITPVTHRRTSARIPPEMSRTMSVRGVKRGRSGILADDTFGLRMSESMQNLSIESRNSPGTIRPPRRRPTSLALFDAYIQPKTLSTTDLQPSPGCFTPRSPRQSNLRGTGCVPERGLRSPIRPKKHGTAILDRHFPLSEEERKRRMLSGGALGFGELM